VIHQQGAYDTDTLIGALGELRRALGGQKPTLRWDGLPAHRNRSRRYGPTSRRVELANLAAGTLEEVIAAAERGIQRIRGTSHLAYSFLRHCSLSLW